MFLTISSDVRRYILSMYLNCHFQLSILKLVCKEVNELCRTIPYSRDYFYDMYCYEELNKNRCYEKIFLLLKKGIYSFSEKFRMPESLYILLRDIGRRYPLSYKLEKENYEMKKLYLKSVIRYNISFPFKDLEDNLVSIINYLDKKEDKIKLFDLVISGCRNKEIFLSFYNLNDFTLNKYIRYLIYTREEYMSILMSKCVPYYIRIIPPIPLDRDRVVIDKLFEHTDVLGNYYEMIVRKKKNYYILTISKMHRDYKSRFINKYKFSDKTIEITKRLRDEKNFSYEEHNMQDLFSLMKSKYISGFS